MTAPTYASPRIAGQRRDRSPASPILHIDLGLVLATLALAAIGIVMVYSATRGPGGPDHPVERFYLQRQATFAGIGVLVMAGLAVFDYRRLRSFAMPIYVIMVVALVLVLSPLGSEAKGAQAWFQFGSVQLQPSELGKLALIISLAAYCSFRNGALKLRHLLVALVIAGVPMGLILVQPDLGTAMVFVAVTTGILWVAGAKLRHVLVLVLVAVIGVVTILNSDLLAEYQKDRLTGFLDPQADVSGTTFNVDQAQITVGAGGVTGQGLFEGPQTRSGLVPEQQTDFIFTVIGEELGFVGSAVVLALFGYIIWRCWRIAKLSADQFGTFICVGVISMLVFQLFQSVGMATGIMPVTGIPLPLLSYGGSSILTTFAALGLVLNVHMRRML